MKRYLAVALFLACLLTLCPVSAAEPAQTDIALSVGADESQMNIAWYSTSSEVGQVLLGERSFASTVTKAKDGNYYSHKATLTGLLPDTEYAYCLVNEGEQSPVYYFKTAPSGDFSFAFAGDPQLGKSSDSAKDRAGWALALQRITEHETFRDTAFLLTAGDHVDEKNNEAHFDDLLHHAPLQSLPMANVIGNHESSSEIFSQHFFRPNESEKYGVTKAGGDCWFTYNNVLFFLINSNDKDTQEHREFMEAVIAAHPDCTWKVVALHHSLYTVANHAKDESILSRREELVPLFDELGIDVVLSGHDHVYCRSYLMDGLTPLRTMDYYDQSTFHSATNPEGVLYVTANSSSGSKTYNPKNEVFSYSAQQHQYKVGEISSVEVTENSFSIRTYRTDTMELLDYFTIYRKQETAHPFADVSAESWYQKAVQYSYTHGLMNGVEETEFAPEGTTTRAMAVTILYRMDGRSQTGKHSFLDVLPDAYYENAVAWATETGIVNGIGKGCFAPDRAVTREELIAMLARYAEYLGRNIQAEDHTGAYEDAEQISPYALAPMNWALHEGLINGMSETELSPRGITTRAQVARIMMCLQKYLNTQKGASQ